MKSRQTPEISAEFADFSFHYFIKFLTKKFSIRVYR